MSNSEEKKIIEFEFAKLIDRQLLNLICSEGYKKTGRKLSISFHGSKGYLSNLEITCEGVQELNINRVFFHNVTGNETLIVYHSKEKGVRLEFGNSHIEITKIIEHKSEISDFKIVDEN